MPMGTLFNAHTLLIAVGVTLLFLFAGAAATVLLMLKTRGSKPAQDQSALLLQQEMNALRAQLSETLARAAEMTQQQLANMTSQVQQQMGQVNQNLQQTTGQISNRIDNYSQIVQGVQHQLGSLSQATEKIFEATKNIASLEEILKPPKLRGSMGEMLLENILSQILPGKDFFALQHGFKNGNTVDAIIRLKDGIIPIDAKFPLDNFRKMIESGDDKERLALRKEFSKNLKKHIDDIAQKYILPDEGTFNFALMYVPAENVYYEIVVRDEAAEDLYSYATARHVFPVSPNSLYPYLMTLALGFRGLKIEKQAKEILGELSRLYGDLEKFSKDFRMVGDHLANAQKKFAEADKKLDKVETKVAALQEGTPGAGQLELLQ